MSLIFISTQIPNGHSWTITTKLGRILQEAESKYGERDKSFTILGVELNCLDYPQTWFPGNTKNIAIQITMECQNDLNRAVYQVAHEIIHCLSPKIGQKANYLEEGLATHFSIEFARNNGHGMWTTDNSKYETALRLIEQLFAIEPEIIVQLRQKQPILSLVTKENILEINSNIPECLADELIRIF
jgi:hypothetical protein